MTVLDKPRLRGVSHVASAFVAALGGLILLLLAGSPAEYVACAVYAISLVLLFAVSGLYHSVPLTFGLRRALQRVDHSMIFVLIAGSYTPFCLLVLGTAWGVTILSVVWALAGAGVLLKTSWIEAPRWLGVTLYLGLGWLALLASPLIASHLGPLEIATLALGGAAYSIGAVVYAVRRPDPAPRVFGYHEVFHLLVILGAALHYSLVVAILVS